MWSSGYYWRANTKSCEQNVFCCVLRLFCANAPRWAVPAEKRCEVRGRSCRAVQDVAECGQSHYATDVPSGVCLERHIGLGFVKSQQWQLTAYPPARDIFQKEESEAAGHQTEALWDGNRTAAPLSGLSHCCRVLHHKAYWNKGATLIQLMLSTWWMALQRLCFVLLLG